ncbi:MAG: hypothetical protein GY838_00565 [bacterium]|nr:hypothetical protein [bacterium]
MLKTVEGTYSHGRIELNELPAALPDRTSVLVTFLDGYSGRRRIPSETADELAEIEAICRHCQALQELDSRSPDEVLDYNERGLP